MDHSAYKPDLGNYQADFADDISGNRLRSLEASAFSRSSSPTTFRWWVPATGIRWDVIQADIKLYLGPDARVKRGERHDGKDRGRNGYWIAAYRTLTPNMIEDLQADSADFEKSGDRGRYEESTVHMKRHYWGPTEPTIERTATKSNQSSYSIGSYKSVSSSRSTGKVSLSNYPSTTLGNDPIPQLHTPRGNHSASDGRYYPMSALKTSASGAELGAHLASTPVLENQDIHTAAAVSSANKEIDLLNPADEVTSTYSKSGQDAPSDTRDDPDQAGFEKESWQGIIREVSDRRVLSSLGSEESSSACLSSEPSDDDTELEELSAEAYITRCRKLVGMSFMRDVVYTTLSRLTGILPLPAPGESGASGDCQNSRAGNEAAPSTSANAGSKRKQDTLNEKANNLKRPLQDDEGGDDQDGDGNRPPKRPKVGYVSSQGQPRSLRLACPFFKHDPIRYQDSRPCKGPGFENSSRVKEHIYRKHPVPIRCQRCNTQFTLGDALKLHARQDIACTPGMDLATDEYTKEKEEQLRRKKKDPTCSEPDKWAEIYCILFPDDAEIPNAYCNVNDNCDYKTLQRYRDYSIQVLPERVLSSISATVDHYVAQQDRETFSREVENVVRAAAEDTYNAYTLHDHAPTSYSPSSNSNGRSASSGRASDGINTQQALSVLTSHGSEQIIELQYDAISSSTAQLTEVRPGLQAMQTSVFNDTSYQAHILESFGGFDDLLEGLDFNEPMNSSWLDQVPEQV